jgi:hypothetical protein
VLQVLFVGERAMAAQRSIDCCACHVTFGFSSRHCRSRGGRKRSNKQLSRNNALLIDMAGNLQCPSDRAKPACTQ